MSPHRAFLPVVLVVVALGVLSITATPSRAVDEFHAFLLPEMNSVEVDSLIQITYEVDETARQFNAYQITIEYDPDIVSFQGVAQGDLMTGACGETYESIAQTDSTVTYDHILLCGALAIDGPGVLSIFSFLAIADGSSELTITTDPNRAFLHDGLYIWPGHAYPRQVFLHDSEICVGNCEDAIDEWDGTLNNAFRVQVAPNPIQDGGWIRYYLAAPSEQVTIEILDISGRQVQHWGLAPRGTGIHELQWEGTDLLGRSLPVGTYFYRARSGNSLDTGKFQVVQ